MIRPTSSANVAKGNMPHRQDHFPHGSAAIMRPTRFTGKMFPSILRLFALHNLLRQTHFPYTNVQQNRFASRVVHFTHQPRFADSIFPDEPGSRHAHMPIRRPASKSTPRALVRSITPLAFVQREYSEGSFNTLRTADSIHYSSASHTVPHCFQIHAARARHVDHPRAFVQREYSADSFNTS